MKVYKSTILPIIDYNDHFQVLWNAEKVQKLQKFQNGGLRIVFSDREARRNEDEMHREAKLSLLKHRHTLKLLNLMYDMSKRNNLLDKKDLHTQY